MINKIYVFNELGETLLRRHYTESIPDHKVRKLIESSNSLNYIKMQSYTIVYTKIDTIYFSFVVIDENEFYIHSVMNHFLDLLKDQLGNISETKLRYNLINCLDTIDRFILNGCVVEFK